MSPSNTTPLRSSHRSGARGRHVRSGQAGGCRDRRHPRRWRSTAVISWHRPGLTWTDPADVAALRDGSRHATRPRHAGFPIARGRRVGTVRGLAHWLPAHRDVVRRAGSAMLAVVDVADGSFVDLHRHTLPAPYQRSHRGRSAPGSGRVRGLVCRPDMRGRTACSSSAAEPTSPRIKPALEAATSLTRHVARGAGHGAGPRGRAGVGECAAVRVRRQPRWHGRLIRAPVRSAPCAQPGLPRRRTRMPTRAGSPGVRRPRPTTTRPGDPGACPCCSWVALAAAIISAIAVGSVMVGLTSDVRPEAASQPPAPRGDPQRRQLDAGGAPALGRRSAGGAARGGGSAPHHNEGGASATVASRTDPPRSGAAGPRTAGSPEAGRTGSVAAGCGARTRSPARGSRRSRAAADDDIPARPDSRDPDSDPRTGAAARAAGVLRRWRIVPSERTLGSIGTNCEEVAWGNTVLSDLIPKIWIE